MFAKKIIIFLSCLLITTPLIQAQQPPTTAPEIQSQSRTCNNNRGYQVHLTFDDGPKIPETQRILETLKKHGIKATFFISASHFPNLARGAAPSANERRLMEVIERMKEDGHTIGSHSFEHIDHTDFSQHSEEQIIANMNRSFAVFRQLGLPRPIPFRFPYGSGWLPNSNPMRQSFNDSLVRRLRENGYRPVHWDIDTEDWSRTKRQALPNSLLEQVCQTGGGIALMHDIHSWTANNLEPLIVSLQRSGHEIVSFRDIQRNNNLRSLRDNPNIPNQEPQPEVSEYVRPDFNNWSGGLY